MKRYAAYTLSTAIIACVGLAFSSCKDDEPEPKPKISFAETAVSVGESDGVINVDLVLDKAYGKDLNVEYTLGGTAKDQDAFGSAEADYEVVGDHGLVVIPSGQTSAPIQLKIYDDVAFEPDETIDISILDVNTSDVEISAEDETQVTITNDDAQLIASFVNTALTVNEDDGVDGPIELMVQLDKPAPADIAVAFNIEINLQSQTESHAIDSTYGAGNDIPGNYWDYKVVGTNSREVVIPAGFSSANIQIQLYTDFNFEDDETIELTLAPTNAVQIGTNSKMVVTIEQQDGKVLALVWDNAHTDVDMDMFLWIGQDTTTLSTDNPLAASITPAVTPRQELIFIPSLITDGAFGLSYVYYAGSADPMNFEIHFADFAAGIVEAVADRDIFAASYTQANINPWDDQAAGMFPPVIEHRFVIEAGVYKYGKLQVPSSSSRRKTQAPKMLRRIPGLRPNRLF